MVLFLLFSCKKEQDQKETHVKNLVEYLKKHEVDSTILSQPFFNEKFRSKGNPYNSYVFGLQQMRTYLINSDVYSLEVDNDNSDIYILSTPENPDSNRIFVLVRTNGIESFSPLLKGKKIVGWM